MSSKWEIYKIYYSNSIILKYHRISISEKSQNQINIQANDFFNLHFTHSRMYLHNIIILYMLRCNIFKLSL